MEFNSEVFLMVKELGWFTSFIVLYGWSKINFKDCVKIKEYEEEKKQLIIQQEKSFIKLLNDIKDIITTEVNHIKEIFELKYGK